MDGSGDKIAIIHERCLGCGRCIPACASHARSINDDTEEFFKELDAQSPMVVLIAPSVVTVFDDIFQLIGFLKSKGILAVFDVSFGAELTTKSYIEFMRFENPELVIAQPCPSIVSYCEIYAPNLIKYLAPIQSPMLHTAIMIKTFFPKYAGAKLAALSPCVAKKREFEETGHIDYNVTFTQFKKFLEKRRVDLSKFEPSDFDGPSAERAVAFSSPGGLRDTLMRDIPSTSLRRLFSMSGLRNAILRDAPSVSNDIRRIDGSFFVYKYLDALPKMIADNAAPFLIDCLNCSSGCNAGPGTGNFGKPIDLLETKVNSRITFKKYRIRHDVNRYWRQGIYNCSYTDRSNAVSSIPQPTNKDIETIFKKMKKNSDDDILNCSACGYGSCRNMAEAIFNKLNRPENCHLYLKKAAAAHHTEYETIIHHIRDGIFLLGRDTRIMPSYSKSLERIFRRDMLAGVPIMNVLGGFLSSEKLPEIDKFISRAFKSSIPDEEIQNDNPLQNVEARFENIDGSFNVFHLNFIIERLHDNDSIQQLFIIVREPQNEYHEYDRSKNLAVSNVLPSLNEFYSKDLLGNQ
jgi:iron only hydrogenase large subunit-like protein